MKLKDLIILVALVAVAFWVGLSGIGTSSQGGVQAGESRAPQPSQASLGNEAPDHGMSGPLLLSTGEENSASEYDSGGPRAAWKLPAIPAEDTGEAAATFQYELAGFLMTGEHSYAELPNLWRRAPSLRSALVRAVGEAQDRRGLAFLAGALGEDADVDGIILSEIGRHAPLADVELAGDVAGPLRWVAKSSDDVTAIQSSVYALGRLRDEESIPLLIALLEESSSGVRTRAARALEAITGLSYRDDPDRWIAWYDNEQRWYEDHVDQLLIQLESDEEEQVFDAVRGLAKLRLYRDDTAAEILLLLRDESPAIRRLACQGLSQLGSTVAIEQLVDCLADPDDSVVQSAWIALRWLTGIDLPADHAAWLAATESRFS
jgi:hypothetical protein